MIFLQKPYLSQDCVWPDLCPLFRHANGGGILLCRELGCQKEYFLRRTFLRVAGHTCTTSSIQKVACMRCCLWISSLLTSVWYSFRVLFWYGVLSGTLDNTDHQDRKWVAMVIPDGTFATRQEMHRPGQRMVDSPVLP